VLLLLALGLPLQRRWLVVQLWHRVLLLLRLLLAA
jgi:hypothetical protein